MKVLDFALRGQFTKNTYVVNITNQIVFFEARMQLHSPKCEIFYCVVLLAQIEFFATYLILLIIVKVRKIYYYYFAKNCFTNAFYDKFYKNN